MKDKNGKELKKDDDVMVGFHLPNKKIREDKCYIHSIIVTKTGIELAMVKHEFARNGGFGSCLVYPTKSEDITLIEK